MQRVLGTATSWVAAGVCVACTFRSIEMPFDLDLDGEWSSLAERRGGGKQVTTTLLVVELYLS
jgi:hypothetical protein